MIKNLIVKIAYIIKFLNIPHLGKYLFFLIIKKHNIRVFSTLEDTSIIIQLNLGEFIEYWIFMDGNYESNWVKEAKKLIKDKTFIDIGSNIGTYSLSLSTMAKQVYSFEAEQMNYSQLNKNVKKNNIKNIFTYKRAVYSKDNISMDLFVSNKDRGWHSLLIPFPGYKQTIKTITIDTFIKEKKVRNIGLIKIDVEGAELDVLNGMINTLGKIHPPILIEFNKPRAKLSGHSTTTLYSVLCSYNYTAFILRKNQLLKLKKKEVEAIYNENVLFLRKKLR